MEKGDFLLVEFEGTANGKVFDSTKGEIAKRLYGKEGPLLIVLGKTKLLKGLEEELYKMKEGEEREILVPPKKGFGTRDKNKVIIINVKKLLEKGISAKKGDILEVNGKLGIVKSVASGRVLIDLNHPLADKVLKFKIKIIKKIVDEKEKAKELLKHYGFYEVVDVEEKEKGLLLRVREEKEKKEEICKAVKELFSIYEIKLELECI